MFTPLAMAVELLLVGSTLAFPSMQKLEGTLTEIIEARQDTHPFIPASSPWVRSPCPGTNTLANHGFISRNGQGVTPQQYQQGFLDAFGFAFDVTQPGVSNTMNLCAQLTGRTCTTFNLDMLATPHAIEHDGSLSRLDRQMIGNLNSDNQRFNQQIWDKTLAVFGADPHIGTSFAHSAQVDRYAQAQQADNPGWFSGAGIGGSNAEAAFYLSAFNDPALGVNLANAGANPQAKTQWVNYFMVNMRLPTAIGWRRPAQTITGAQIASLSNMVARQTHVSGNPGPSPFQQKRDLSSPEAPSTSYSLSPRNLHDGYVNPHLDTRDAEKNVFDIRSHINERGIIPLASLPSIAAQPQYASAIAVAKQSASAVAGPPPADVNPYAQVLSPEEWGSKIAAGSAYVASVQSAFETILPQVIQSPPL